MKRARTKALPRKKKAAPELEKMQELVNTSGRAFRGPNPEDVIDTKKPWESPTLTEVEPPADDNYYKSFVSPESSTIMGAMWSALAGDTRGAMRVVFKRANSQDAYDYESVPSELFDQFSAAESKGVFFATQIRPHYIGRRHGERT